MAIQRPEQDGLSGPAVEFILSLRRNPQIGRFLGVDPLATRGGQDMFSPYAAMGNAPEIMVDPNGTQFTDRNGAVNNSFSANARDYSEIIGAGSSNIGCGGGWSDRVWGGGMEQVKAMAAAGEERRQQKLISRNTHADRGNV